MPKIVDHQQRREAIADAVFALIDRGGVEQASLRNVAEEAGLNIGSVRHYVDGHAGMLIDAVHVMSSRVARRIEERVARFEWSGDVTAFRSHVLDLLEELLPLDEERRLEVVVWLAFSERSRIDSALRAEARAMLDGARTLTFRLLGTMGIPEPRLPSESLSSAVDGLTIALLHDPERLTRPEVREILDRQLRSALTWGTATDR